MEGEHIHASVLSFDLQSNGLRGSNMLTLDEEQSGTASTLGAITAHVQCGLMFLLLLSGTNSLP